VAERGPVRGDSHPVPTSEVVEEAHGGDIHGAFGTIRLGDQAPRRTWRRRLLTLAAIVGLVGYLKHFMGPVLWLAPLMFIIEMIGNFARILSLGVRLFGNIFGEHTATGIFMGLAPLIVPWPMMGLGIFGAFLQTFVFIMLTMVYIGGAVAVEEH